MYAFVEDATGDLVAYGDDPDGVGIHDGSITTVNLGDDDRLSNGYGYWDPATRTVKDVAVAPDVVEAAVQVLTDPTKLETRLAKLSAYKTDADLAAVLANPNNTALSTQQLNRALKTMIRREERLTAAVAALIRLMNPDLLGDISDTTDA